jgi:uncharacterized delta-60 repeat protein
MVVDPSFRILVSGYGIYPSTGDSDMVVWRLLPDGTTDLTFGGSSGYVVYDFSSLDEEGKSISLDGSGGILVTGYHSDGTDPHMALWRCDENGLDTTFGFGGLILDSSPQTNGNSITTDSVGRILITGSHGSGFSQQMSVWRYSPSGTPDNTFDGDGVATYPSSGLDAGSSIVLDSRGRLLVSGVRQVGASWDMAVWRISSEGLLDPTFGTGGIFSHDNAAGGHSWDLGTSLALDSVGYLLVTGLSYNGTSSDLVVWRLR